MSLFRRRHIPLLFLLICCCPAIRTFADAPPSASAETTRAAFLRIIERPRVDAAPKVEHQSSEEGIARFHFTFASDASNRVPGLLLEKEEFLRDGKRHPVIIAAHGTGGSKDKLLPLLKKLAGKGFIAVAIDGRYHGERGKIEDYYAAIAKAWEQGGAHPLYYDTVWDLLRLIDYLQTRSDVDPNRIGLTGFSKGGIETWMASAVDPRIACAIPCIGVQSFRWAIENDAWQARMRTFAPAFKSAAKSAGVEADVAFLRRFYDRVLPGIYGELDGPAMLPLSAPRPLMVINGDKDPNCPLAGAELCIDAAKSAYAKAGASDKFRAIIESDTGHKVTPQAQDEAIAWFEKWLK